MKRYRADVPAAYLTAYAIGDGYYRCFWLRAFAFDREGA